MRTLIVALLIFSASCSVAEDPRIQGFEREVIRLARLAASIDTPDGRGQVREQLEKLLGENRELATEVITILTTRDYKARCKAENAILANDAGSLPLMPAIILGRESFWTGKDGTPLSAKMRRRLRQLTRPPTSPDYLLRLPPPSLVELCGHEHPAPRRWALYVLSDFGPAAKMTIPKLIGILSEPYQDEETRRAVLCVIRSIGREAEPALPAVLNQLLAGSQVGLEACQALKAIGEPSVEPLMRSLSSPSPKHRKSAASALAHMGEAAKAALPSLRKAMHDQDAMVRVDAANAVWRVGREADQAAPVLVDALSDKLAGRWAGFVLHEIGAAAAPSTNVMMEALVADNVDLSARLWILRTLAEVGPEAKQAAPLLKTLACEGPVAQRIAAAFAVWKVTGDARTANSTLTSVLEGLPSDQKGARTSAIRTLGKMGPAAAPAIPVLVGQLKYDISSRHYAGRVLKEFGVAALPELRKATQSDDQLVRDTAEQLIRRIEKEHQNRAAGNQRPMP